MRFIDLPANWQENRFNHDGLGYRQVVINDHTYLVIKALLLRHKEIKGDVEIVFYGH
jgi:hypothetical protein